MEDEQKFCPECLEPLEYRSHKVFYCWICPQGHGTYYPKGELEQIVAAVAGLGDLEVRIWNEPDRYTVVQSSLCSPDGNRFLMEIRDKDFPTIMVYGDPVTHSLWLHTGEEEKLADLLGLEAQADSVASYLALAAREAASIFNDDVPLKEATGHMLTALKLLGERLLRAFPYLPL